jgi:Zn-dependent protease
MRDRPRDAWDDALIAAGGPVAGTIASYLVAMAADVTDAQVLYDLADLGYLINFFNLLPLGSMDGGRWVGAFSKYGCIVGVGIGGCLVLTGTIVNPLFYLILIAGGYETYKRVYNPHIFPPNYGNISTIRRLLLSGGYLGLVAFLMTAMVANQQRQKSPEMILQEQERKLDRHAEYRLRNKQNLQHIQNLVRGETSQVDRDPQLHR